MITGLHGMYYSSQAVELREFFRDKLGLPCFDAGGGWLIFDGLQADLGAHPTDFPEAPPSGTADVSFTCDDINATVNELKAKGVEFSDDVKDAGFGFITHMKAPGNFTIMLYQPKYERE